MKKNVGSQVVGCQMVSATDGSAFTGSVTAYITVDGGTQAIGGTASGVCTHEGNGFHSYVPTAGETNGDHIAFTFIGTGAVPATVQVYTTFPQTGDSFARIGATGSGLTSLATASALATVDTNVDSILVDTAEIGAAGAGLTALASASALATVDTVVDGIQTDLSSGTDGLGAIKTAVDAIPTSNPTAASIADAVLDEALAGHATAGTLGKAVADIEADATAILADTGTTIPAQITALNDLDSTAVQSAAAAALTAYDPPTKTEMDSGFAALNDLSSADVNAACDTAISDAALATAAALATVDAIVDAILVDSGTTIPGLIAALNDISVADVLTTQMTESYPADGTAPTLAQAVFLIQQFLYERATSGTTVTVKQLDGATTAATLTLNDGTTPTSITRAS